MNMISTGAFPNEMDASNKLPSVAEKFAAIWEKKNAKAARAGGVSLMALSLAACGGSSSTTTTTTDTSTDTSTDTTTTTPTGQTLALVNTGTTTLDNVTGGAGDDTITAAAGRMNDGDAVTGGAGTDTLTATIDGSADAYIDGVETINITSLGASSVNGVRITGAETINVSGAGTLTIANAAAGLKYGVTEAGTGLTVTQTGSDGTANATTVTLGAGKLGTITMGDTTGVDFETINLIIDGDGSATFTEAGTPTFADSGDSIVVTGSGDYTLLINDGELGAHGTAGSETAATIDASGHTGKLTIDLDALTTTNNVSGEKWTGVDAVRIETAAANSDVNKLTKIASGTEVVVGEIESANNELVITPNGSSTSDTLTVTLNDEDKGGSIDLTKLTVDGFESVTINSTGTDKANADGTTTKAANVVDLVAGTTTDKTLTITGDKKFTSTNVENTWTSITSSNTTGVNLTVASGGDLTFTGGAGADRLELDTMADITSADTLKGGDGKDTLALSQVAGTDFSTTQLAAFSGFEVLEYTTAQDYKSATGARTIDLTKITGVNELVMKDTITTDTGGVTLTVKAEDGFAMTMGAHSVDGGAADQFDIQVKDAGVAGSANTVSVNMINITGNTTNGGFQIDGVETLNLNVAGDASHTYTLSDIDGAVLSTLNIASTNTGVNADGTAKDSDNLTITTAESTLITTVNAGTFTGDLDINGLGAKFAATGATVTSGSGDDKITGGTGADILTSGKGADTVLGGTGADQITSGAGADIVLAATGADATPEKTSATVVGSNTGALTTGDAVTVTLFGKSFTVTHGDTVNAVTVNNVAKAATALVYKVNADADIAKLVTTTDNGAAAISFEANVDGNFTDFVISAVTGTTTAITTTNTQVSGTASTDIDVIDLGDGADFAHASGGADKIDLGAADGDADTVVILTLSEGKTEISNFEAGSVGSDVIKFAGDLLNNGSSEASTLVSIAKDGATADNRVFFEITSATAASGADTAAEIVTHLTSLTLTSIANGDDIVFAINDTADTYLWQFTEDGNAGIQADDLTLVGIMKGVTDIVDGDLAQIA